MEVKKKKKNVNVKKINKWEHIPSRGGRCFGEGERSLRGEGAGVCALARPPECKHAYANQLKLGVGRKQPVSSCCARKLVETRPRESMCTELLIQGQIIWPSSKDCETHKVTDSCHVTQRLQLLSVFSFFCSPPSFICKRGVPVISGSCWFRVITEQSKTTTVNGLQETLKIKKTTGFLKLFNVSFVFFCRSQGCQPTYKQISVVTRCESRWLTLSLCPSCS